MSVGVGFSGGRVVIVQIVQFGRLATTTCGGVFGRLPPLPPAAIRCILPSLLLRASGGWLLGPPGGLHW